MKPESILKLKRIENTLRAAGKPAAAYLADDIAQLLADETGEEGLTAEELAYIHSGNPIGAIKKVRARKSVGGVLFGLREAKDFVEAAGQKLGLYCPNAPADLSRWTTVHYG